MASINRLWLFYLVTAAIRVRVPAFNRFAGFSNNGGMPEACDTRKSYRKILTDMFESELSDASVEDMKKTIEKAKSRLANKKPLADEDEDGIIPPIDKGHNMTDPFMKMLDKQALAHQAKFGGSYEQAFTKVYTSPANASIRDAATYEHLARGHDDMFGYRLATPVKKVAPMDAVQDDVDPGSAEYELHRLTVERMKNSSGMSYQRAFTHEYLNPANRSLKERVSDEGILRMQARAPAKPFPAYTSPGHDERDTVNIGREGRRPKGYAGG
jgi:hypothetical protein